MSNITKAEAPTIRMGTKCPHCGKDIVVDFYYEDMKDKIRATEFVDPEKSARKVSIDEI